MLGATDKITALYCRLSAEYMKEGKNDEKDDESNSIQTQKNDPASIRKAEPFSKSHIFCG